MPNDLNWYVAIVRPQLEFRAERDIQDLGFETYIPRCRRNLIIARHRRPVEWPLLPGYVFVSFSLRNERSSWQEICSVEGVGGILPSNNTPVPVKDFELDRLRRSENAGAFDFTIPATTFQVGMSYRIADGPFANFIARFRSASSKKRVRIAVEFFGGSVDLDVDACILEQIA